MTSAPIPAVTHRAQRSRHWFTDDLFLGLMRIRGAEARSPSGYAEGFYGRKLRFDLGAASS